MTCLGSHVSESWGTQSWFLGSSALYLNHTSGSFQEMVSDKCSGVEAWSNKKAFENYTWIPCSGHNHLAVDKALSLGHVSACLCRLWTTVSAVSGSNKIIRSLTEKLKTLKLPKH